jgi:hypothetical protein
LRLDLNFVTYSMRRGWKPGSGLPSRQAEQAGLVIASGGGALRHRTATLLQFEQDRLFNSRRCRHLLAAALQKLAPEKALAIDVDEISVRAQSPSL